MRVLRLPVKFLFPSLVVVILAVLVSGVVSPELSLQRGFLNTVQAATDLDVAVGSSEILSGFSYVRVDANMSGSVPRNDGSEGTYNVPLTFFYPLNSRNCNDAGIVDVVNSVLYETFPDQPPPPLFPFASLLLGDDFIFGAERGGYVYAQVRWNKLVIERLADPTVHIEEGTDGYFIIRDASRFLRNPSQYLTGPAPSMPCAVSDVLSFGYSQTGQLLRSFYFKGLNAELADGDTFDDGLVFEGSIHAVGGASCRELVDEEPWYSYSMENCEGATPASEGKVFNINTETDVQILGGWRARGKRKDKNHYRNYEIAGSSHLPFSLFNLVGFGLRPEGPEQNYADLAPVFRAMMQNLYDWVKSDIDPPGDAEIEGRVGKLDSSLFSNLSWGSHEREVFKTKLGIDGNALGGIRLVHVRTEGMKKTEIGGPLGLYRGAECFNDPTDSDYILQCSEGLSEAFEDFSPFGVPAPDDAGFFDTAIYALNGGAFKPYTEGDLTLCQDFYPDRDAYLTAVTKAAEAATDERWILPEEVDQTVFEAEMKADEFGGCVPPPSP